MTHTRPRNGQSRAPSSINGQSRAPSSINGQSRAPSSICFARIDRRARARQAAAWRGIERERERER
eukprot:3325017-Rhodomonas_salina.2